jgi:hypothetical protein
MSSYAASAAAMSKVLASIDAQIYRYAGDVYAELQFSDIQASLFEDSRTAVDATFATMAGAALKNVDSISERLAANDAEAVSQAMTTCRRLIDSVADHVFPASDDSYDLNGQTLNVKQHEVLNRINAFVHTRGVAEAEPIGSATAWGIFTDGSRPECIRTSMATKPDTSS